MVVLGDSLGVSTHQDNPKTAAIIAGLKAVKPAIQIFGYIDVGVSGGPTIHNLTNAQLAQAIDGWKAMGVTGVFGDDFGSDFGVNRTRQNYFIDYAKGKGLTLFVNSRWVKDALAGTDCHLSQNDYYLMESLVVGNNAYQSLDAFKKKSDSAASYQKQGKIKVAVVGTTAPGAATAASGSTDKFTMGWYATALYNFDAYQFTDFWHSASNNKLFFYTDPISNYGSQWQDTVPVKFGAGQFIRRSDKYNFYVEGDGTGTGKGYGVPR